MDAIEVSLGKEIAAHINNFNYSDTVAATRHFLRTDDLKDLATLSASIVVFSVTTTVGNRTQNHHDYLVHTALTKQLPTGDVTSDATLVSNTFLLAQEVYDRINREDFTLEDGTKAHWKSQIRDPLYDWELLREQNLFVTVIQTTYLVPR